MPNLISPNEIDINSFLDDYLLNILVFTNVADIELIEVEENCRILEATDIHFKYVKLQDIDGKNLSVVRLEQKIFNNRNYYLINKSFSFVQQKGYGSTVYEYCFCYLEFPIISDRYQTKAGSSNLWAKLHKKQNKNFDIYTLNEKNNKEIRLNKKLSDYAIWGVDSEAITIYKETPTFYDEDFDTDIQIDTSDDFYDPFITVGEIYIHEQLEKFIKDGLTKKVSGKRIKQKVTDRRYLRLVGKKNIN